MLISRNHAFQIAMRIVLAAPVLLVVSALPQHPKGLLRITVRDDKTNYAVQANLSIKGPEQLSRQTDATGRLRLNLEPGEYQIEISAPLHKVMRTHYRISAGRNLPIGIILDPESLTPEERPEAISAQTRQGFTLLHGYTVDGETGQPLAGVKVRIVRGAVQTITDQKGHYDLLVRTPGSKYPGGMGMDTLIYEKPGYKKVVFENFGIAGDDMGGTGLGLERGKGVITNDAMHKLLHK